jgi:hypothetical protein
MNNKVNRRPIRAIAALLLGLLVATTIHAARGRRIAIDSFPFNWQNEIVVAFDDDADGGNHRTPDPVEPPGDPQPEPVLAPIPLPAGMTLNIGGQTFNRVWINENGFVSFTENVGGTVTGEPEQFQAPGPASFEAVIGNVIAPFYADAVTRPPATDPFVGSCHENGASQGEDCDVTYAMLVPQSQPPNPPPPYDRGMRITWGFGQSGGDPGGLAQNGGADPTLRNRFQLKLIDQSGEFEDGDFDIEFNYNSLRWETGTTLVGLKMGDAVMDFSKFYESFRVDVDLMGPLPANHVCFGNQADTNPPAAPSFDRNRPLPCNIITIEVRGGVPRLAAYTANVSVELRRGSTGTLNSAVNFPVDVVISNGNDDPATNVTATIQLPNETTIASAPQGVTCTPGTGSSRCTFGTFPPNDVRSFTLLLRSMQDGPRTYSARVEADQYDFDATRDNSTLPLTLAPSADLSITGCTAPASVQQNSSATVTCTVRNSGPQTASGVALDIDLPSIVTFGSGNGCTASGTRITCSAPGSLAANTTTTFSATLNAVSAGTASLAVTVRATENDPVANNNAGSGFTISAPVVQPPQPQPSGGGGGGFAPALLTLLLLLHFTRRKYGLPRRRSS